MDFPKAELKPTFISGIEAAYDAVEKKNKELYKMVENLPWRQGCHTIHPPVKVAAVVIAELADGQRVLCFCGDEMEEQNYGIVSLSVPKRYMLPITEVVEYINLIRLHPAWGKDLTKMYGAKFSPKRPLRDHMKDFSRKHSSEEILGHALFQVLKKGYGDIPRMRDRIVSSQCAENDEPFRMLSQKASEYMEKTGLRAFAA